MFVILVGVTDHRMNIFLGFYLVKKELRAEDFMHTNLCCKDCKNWLIRISLVDKIVLKVSNYSC